MRCVHTPELPEERVTKNVLDAVRSQKITHPVMLDADYSYWAALDNKYWPAFYVVDKQGRIAAEAIGEMHVGDARAEQFERKIKRLVHEGEGEAAAEESTAASDASAVPDET